MKKIRIPHNIIKEVIDHRTPGRGRFPRPRHDGSEKDFGVQLALVPMRTWALLLASELACPGGIQITALRLMPDEFDEEKREDELLHLHEIIEEELGEIPPYITPLAVSAPSVVEGILAETQRQTYDLMIIGALRRSISHPRYVFGGLE